MDGLLRFISLFILVNRAMPQVTGNSLTYRQFAAFVGGTEKTRQIGLSFQAARARTSATTINRSALSAEAAGVRGICENIASQCNSSSPYRTADGSCNNLANPTWGKAAIPMKRWIAPLYDDGISKPRTKGRSGQELPSARFVSTTVHGTQDIKDIPKEKDISHMVMQWGHFLDHDITQSPRVTLSDTKSLPINCCDKENAGRFPCFPIPIPLDDPFFKTKRCFDFVRSIQVPNANCTIEPVEQMNALTAFVDSSNVYGSGDIDNLRLFRDGLLRFGPFNLLPDDDTMGSDDPCDMRCFDAGDTRRNEQMGLTSMHTLFMREHNRIARTLKKYNFLWDDEKLYQESRKIVGAIAQKITYSDWLQIVLDPQTMLNNGLNSPPGFENVYDPSVDPSVRNVFGAAAFRFGHSLVRSAFTRRNPVFFVNSVVQTSDIFGKTSIIRNSFGQAVDQFLRGLAVDRVGKVDRFITPELTNLLFKSPNDSLDLASLNIQRGRDHGTAPYNDWREWCGLPKAFNFTNGSGGFIDHSLDAVKQLARAYRGLSPDDVDVFPAAIAEKPLPGGLLGPTFACIIGRQFGNLKRGDRFWYKLNNRFTGFREDQLREIEKASLARIICDNTSTFVLQRNVFKRVSNKNIIVPCSALPRVDLRQWKERTEAPQGNTHFTNGISWLAKILALYT